MVIKIPLLAKACDTSRLETGNEGFNIGFVVNYNWDTYDFHLIVKNLSNEYKECIQGHEFKGHLNILRFCYGLNYVPLKFVR